MGLTPVQLPGFGRPVNCYQKQNAFPSVLNPIDMNRGRIE